MRSRGGVPLQYLKTSKWRNYAHSRDGQTPLLFRGSQGKTKWGWRGHQTALLERNSFWDLSWSPPFKCVRLWPGGLVSCASICAPLQSLSVVCAVKFMCAGDNNSPICGYHAPICVPLNVLVNSCLQVLKGLQQVNLAGPPYIKRWAALALRGMPVHDLAFYKWLKHPYGTTVFYLLTPCSHAQLCLLRHSYHPYFIVLFLPDSLIAVPMPLWCTNLPMFSSFVSFYPTVCVCLYDPTAAILLRV